MRQPVGSEILRGNVIVFVFVAEGADGGLGARLG